MGYEKTVFIGIGNDVLSDDRIGPYLARRLGNDLKVSFRLLTHLSLDLLDCMNGENTAFIIDSFYDPDYPVGGIKTFLMHELESGRNPTYSHGVTIPLIYRFGKKIGSQVPRKIVIFGINVSDNLTLSEDFSEKIQERIDEIAENLEVLIKKMLEGLQ